MSLNYVVINNFDCQNELKFNDINLFLLELQYKFFAKMSCIHISPKLKYI